MTFGKKLRQVMQELNLTQTQLCAMTGIGKSSVSQYLSDSHVPTEERQRSMAIALGLDPDFFASEDTIKIVPVTKVAARGEGIRRMSVYDAARLMGMSHTTIRKGLKQGVFPWGYAIKTSENCWAYFINAESFAQTEHIQI